MAIELIPNASLFVENAVESQGNLVVLVGGIVLIAAAFVTYKILKDLMANVIIGAIALIIVTQVLKIPIPLNLGTILVALIFGVGGVGALMVLTYLGVLV